MRLQKTSILAFIGFVSLIALASWLYIFSQLDHDTHRLRIATVMKLQQLTGELVKEVLLVESGEQSNFDKLAKVERQLDQELANNRLTNVASDSLIAEIERLLSVVSKIKSAHSVYRNSLAYYPQITRLLREKLEEVHDKHALMLLAGLENDIIRYSSFSIRVERDSKELIGQKVIQLKTLVSAYDGVDSFMIAFSAHAVVLLKYSDRLFALNGQLLNNNVSKYSQQLMSQDHARFDDDLLTSKRVKNGFYVAVFVLLFLSFIFWRRQHSSFVRLQKNAETLEFSLKIARQKLFSIDIAAAEITLGDSHRDLLNASSNNVKISIAEWTKSIHPDDQELAFTALSNSLKTGDDLDIDYRWRSQNKGWLWVNTAGQIIEKDQLGKPLIMAGLSSDINDRKTTEELLRDVAESGLDRNSQADVLRTIVEGLAKAKQVKFVLLGVLSSEKERQVDTLVLWAGDGFVDNISYSLNGTPCENIIKETACLYPDDIQTLFPEDHMLVEMGAVSYIGVPLRDTHNRTVGLLACLDDKSMKDKPEMELLLMSLAARASVELERKEITDRLTKMAHYDSLTGLPNRALLSDRFLQAQAHSERKKSLLAVCFLDLDDFKPINDEFGHDVGDQLLKEVANRLSDSIRGDDTVCRLGGDEFVLLIGEIETVEECELSLGRIVHEISMPYQLEGKGFNISASIGYSLTSKSTEDLDSLIRQADQAMYAAKKQGKNRYSAFNFESDHKASIQHRELERIRQGLNNDEFQLFYQPKVNMRTGKVYGAEALIRWLHPDKGLIPPFNFLPTIDGSNLEVSVGNWVINKALQQMSTWEKAGIYLEVSVNISSFHLMAGDFVTQLQASLERYPTIKASSFQLEVLESSILTDIESISDILQECRDKLGVRVALDDFGTGYSSLTHLRQLPAGTIKIDRSFIRNILDDPNDFAIVKAVTGLAASFDLNIIAEGVELDDQGLKLLSIDCECAQGFGIAKPMPADEMEGWLAGYKPNKRWLNFAKEQAPRS